MHAVKINNCLLTYVLVEAVELIHPDRGHSPIVAAHCCLVVGIREGDGRLLLVDVTYLKAKKDFIKAIISKSSREWCVIFFVINIT